MKAQPSERGATGASRARVSSREERVNHIDRSASNPLESVT
jgi:hypothetical protein